MERRKVFLTGLLVFLCASVAYAQSSSIFKKYGDKSNVSSVYISKTMLEMQPNLYANDMYIGKVAGQLDAVYIVSSHDNKLKKDLRSDIEDYIKKGKFEVLMKQKGLVSASSIYIKKKGDKVKELVMVTDGAAKLTFTQMFGELTLKDIQHITNSHGTGCAHLFTIPNPERSLTHIDILSSF